MLVNPYDGRPCGCGSRGCLEAEVGERALLDAAGRPADLFGRDAVREVVEAADRGEPAARDALRTVGDWLGIGVANLINLFNPGMVVFGGMLREVYRGAATQVQRTDRRQRAAGLRVAGRSCGSPPSVTTPPWSARRNSASRGCSPIRWACGSAERPADRKTGWRDRFGGPCWWA